MISAVQWTAYNKACASITGAANASVTSAVQEFLDGNPDVSIAEARDAAERILKSYSGVYNQQAAALAAEWYDAQGKAAGAKLDRAVTSATVDEDSLRKTVHYQARLLEYGEGDFAAAVGEWAENAAKRAINNTVLANAKRDRRKGVRFARVTSGRNTCAFCLMLAGRGAVYHTRKTAGEFNRYHRHCSCKVVPSYSGNQYEVLVEGHDPKKIQDRLIEIENLTGTTRGTAAFEREVILRDPGWLYGGDIEVESEEGARPNEREMGTAKSLANAGIKCTFRATRESESKRTSDVLINDAPWEFKQPQGTGKNNIYNQFNEASGQSDKLVIDCSRSPFGFKGVCARAESSLARRSDFSEVIVCGDGGYAHFIK
jgi:hypothetical protein